MKEFSLKNISEWGDYNARRATMIFFLHGAINPTRSSMELNSERNISILIV